MFCRLGSTVKRTKGIIERTLEQSNPSLGHIMAGKTVAVIEYGVGEY
jgi:hypothetical protein